MGGTCDVGGSGRGQLGTARGGFGAMKVGVCVVGVWVRFRFYG